MITDVQRRGLDAAGRSQIERKELARGAWAEGRPDDALLIMEEVLAEEMLPPIAAECYVTKAAFLAEKGDWEGSLESLERAAPILDSAPLRVSGTFYHQRARVHRHNGNLDAALADYTGAAVCWQTSDSKDLEGITYLNIAHVFLLIGDLEQARSNLERAFDIFRAHSHFYLSQAYDTLANLELEEGRIEAALSAIRTAFDLVGENEPWRETFAATQAKIDTKLLELLSVERVEDLDRIKGILVRNALLKTGGNLSRAGRLIGLTYKGVDYIVQQNAELQSVRSPRKPRLKSILKKTV